jgi:hypothetical protein
MRTDVVELVFNLSFRVSADGQARTHGLGGARHGSIDPSVAPRDNRIQPYDLNNALPTA